MSSIDKELLNIIRKIKNRIHAIKLMEFIVLGIAAALVIGIVTVLISRFFPIYNPYGKTAIIGGICIIIAMGYGIYKRPTKQQAALKIDSLGLKERVITAIELISYQSQSVQSPFAELEKRDALNKLKKLDYKKGIPVRVNKRYLIVCLILTVVLASVGFIPNPMAKRADQIHETKQKITAQQKKVDNIIKQVKADPKLTKEQKEELEKKLKELKKELNNAKSEKDMDKALKKSEKKLELLQKEQEKNKDTLNKIMDALSKNQITKSLADVLKSKSAEELKKELKNLENKLKNISEEEKKKLAEDLKALAEELKNNPELAQALSDLSSKLANGELGNLSESLNQISKAMEQLMNSEDLKQTVSDINEQLQKMQSGQNNGAQSQGGQNDNGHISSGSQGNQSQGSQNNGQGNGKGNGNGGGAGSGTNMGTENPTPVEPSGGIGKKDGSVKKLGEYEEIFTSKTLGGDGEQSNLSGTKGDNGNTQQINTDQTQTIKGDSVPYNQVFGEYKSSALESINSSDIPSGMKDIIKDYFSSLEE